MNKKLYLLRHGDTAANGKFIGSTDLPVAPSGYIQLEVTRSRLQSCAIDSVFCSPMLRCRQTADFLQLPVKNIENSNLKEIDFGSWEGLTFDDISSRWPEKVNDWSNWSNEFTFPEGESIENFLARVYEVKKCIDDFQETDILVVTHGGIIRHLICLYLGLPPEKYLLFNVKAGHFVTLELYSEGGVLTALN